MADEVQFEELPPLYQRWTLELLGARIPRETNATCTDCAMCRKPAMPGEGSEPPFNKITKCCTYLPELPNYLVGLTIRDLAQESTGFKTVKARIDRRIGVTPLGLQQLPSFMIQYDSMGDVGFGRIPSWICPHYEADGGKCSIWAYRNSVCAAWFCKHVRGALGERFWDALRTLLYLVEIDLAAHCAFANGIPADAIAEFGRTGGSRTRVHLTAELAGDHEYWSSKDRWTHWANNYEPYFVRCAELVASMAWSDVVATCGGRVAIQAHAVVSSFSKMHSTALPSLFRVSRLTILRDGPTSSTVSTYRTYDPLSLDNDLVGVLRYFDGRPHEEVRSQIREEVGLEIDDQVLRRLLDYGILTERGAGRTP